MFSPIWTLRVWLTRMWCCWLYVLDWIARIEPRRRHYGQCPGMFLSDAVKMIGAFRLNEDKYYTYTIYIPMVYWVNFFKYLGRKSENRWGKKYENYYIMFTVCNILKINKKKKKFLGKKVFSSLFLSIVYLFSRINRKWFIARVQLVS